MVASSSSVRQSPPPITGVSGMPNGAIMSPPDSASDDDDLPQVRSRRVENLKELHEAVSQIPQQRARLTPDGGSPEQDRADAGDLLLLPSQATALAEGMHHSFSTGSLDELKMGDNRRFTHSRSATEPHVSVGRSTGSSTTGSDEESDEGSQQKPQMVRKKSGELVRPALRPASRRRPSSMPGTPTFSKVVHFDAHLEHVRHFLQVDRPLAVSAGSSPVDSYDSDTEYPFSSDGRSTTRSPPFEWEIIMTNFPVDTPVRKAQMVRLEKVWLSTDQKSLVGSVAVANLAFQKFVACRFTLDYWKTTSEVAAEYVGEVVRPVDTPYTQDRFNFSIKLSDLANLETKTLYFCVRYVVNGQEYWDNNNSTNFQIDFRKKFLPQNGKKGAAGAATRSFNGLPKSNRRSGQKSKPSSTASDEFGDSQKLNFDKSIHDYLGETGPTGLRLKAVKSAGDLPSDNPSKGLLGPSGQFASRYDFGDSLSKAIQNAKTEIAGRSEGLYMKSRKKAGSPISAETGAEKEKAQAPASTGPSTTTAGAPITSPAESPSAIISSASYEEIVSKWCFYGSKPRGQSSKPRLGPFEGADDTDSRTASYDGSPLGNYYQRYSSTRPQMPRPRDQSPYFTHVPVLGGMAHAPAETPLGHSAGSPSGESTGSAAQQQTAGTAFAHLAGTPPNEYPYQRSHDRFPFHGTETYAPAAIRG
ncbi:putative phosphatase regulatory subunit-domain-containing protein [Thermothelomyces heterothallicus CBS 202.75]|uniref:putative phosphatase regulatory subunit-domain-containing protein n=1 Tax=Thermothelomyces heterothallicus CBS 202.75 TaxID=1149848 RepID=UPI00374451F7